MKIQKKIENYELIDKNLKETLFGEYCYKFYSSDFDKIILKHEDIWNEQYESIKKTNDEFNTRSKSQQSKGSTKR